MNASHFTFKKEERLTGKKLIDELFETGSSFYLQPFKIFFLEKNTSLNPVRTPARKIHSGGVHPDGLPEKKVFPVQILISVPTKNFRRAVDRNKIKRLIRESYRLNKHVLYRSMSRGFLSEEKKNKQLILALLYTSKTIESFNFIQEKIIAILSKLAGKNFTGEKHSK